MMVNDRTSWAARRVPRAWQAAALEGWSKDLKGIASVVTGGGKTAFAQMCMQVFRERYRDGRFVIVVPTLALLDQWYVSLREDLAVPEDDISLYSGDGFPDEANIVNLMVVNTARRHARPIAERFPVMLIADECHRVASPANARALAGTHQATLGLSATPVRQYDDLCETVLVPALGPVFFEYDYTQALADGVIVPFDLVNVEADLANDEQQRYDRMSRDIARTFHAVAAGKMGRETLKRKLMSRARLAATARYRVPVAVRLAEAERGSRMLIFHEQIEAAERIAGMLAARKFNATLYHSKISPEVRRDNLRLYRRGLFDVLVTCRALDEGLDVPETENAIIASGTASVRQRIQRLGRVLRPAAGKLRAKVYTVYATPAEQERLVQEAQRLEGTGDITWMRASLRGHGASAD